MPIPAAAGRAERHTTIAVEGTIIKVADCRRLRVADQQSLSSARRLTGQKHIIALTMAAGDCAKTWRQSYIAPEANSFLRRRKAGRVFIFENTSLQDHQH